MNNLNFPKLDVFKNNEKIKLNFNIKKNLINYLVSESSYLTNTITQRNKKKYEQNNEKRKKKFYEEILKIKNYENNFESFVNIEKEDWTIEEKELIYKLYEQDFIVFNYDK